MNDVDWIFSVVNSFYDKAKVDILIGYHFRNVSDFDEHIPRIASFWELQLLGRSSRPLSQPFDVINKHIPLGIKSGELGRWMILFKKTIAEQIFIAPEKSPVAEIWESRLTVFEGIFLKTLRL